MQMRHVLRGAWCDCIGYIIPFSHAPNCADGAFYLAPLSRPKEENCWFKRTPPGRCKLAEVVSHLMKSAGILVYFTNHSLRATATTRFYDDQVIEATIMERTGHRSTDGVRAYKRTSDKLKKLSSNVLNQSSAKNLRTEGGSEAVVADTNKHDLACACVARECKACFALKKRPVPLFLG